MFYLNDNISDEQGRMMSQQDNMQGETNIIHYKQYVTQF